MASVTVAVLSALAFGSVVARNSGPFYPGPNAAAMVSYDWRIVVSLAALPSSLKPRRMLSTGRASRMRMPSPMANAGHGRRWTVRLHLYQKRS